MSVITPWLPFIGQAFLVTLWMSAVVVVVSALLGLLVAIVRIAKLPVLSQIFLAYEELFRNTPLLIQLFFIFFGLNALGAHLSATASALIGASLLGGAYMAAAFRGGFNGVERVQVQSGKALGMSKAQRIRYITIPQGLSRSMPALAANAIFLVKETSVFTVIAVPELTNQVRILNTINYQTSADFLSLVVGYAIILVPLSIVLTLLERRVRRATFSN